MPDAPPDAVVLRFYPTTGVVVLTLNRPSKRNAVSEKLRLDLIDALADADVLAARIVILTGAGGVFSAGADLVETVGISTEQRLASWDRLMQAINDLEMPVIAAVEGLAYGAGFELALACDMIIAARDARFALPEVEYGFLPGCGGTQRLARAVGKQRAMALVLAAETLCAEEAMTLGVLSKLSTSGAALEDAIAMARKIADCPEQAVNNTRRAIADGLNLPLQQGLALERTMLTPLIESPELRERAGRFKDSRRSGAT